VTGAEIAVFALVGLTAGSFLNVCISRLPAGQSVVRPRSRCPACGAAIGWRDNVPIVSYLLLRGRCRACGRSISPRYPLVEALTAVAFALMAARLGGDPVLLASRLIFAALLIALFWTDLETQRLPNELTLPGVVIGCAFSLLGPPGPAASLLGAALGGGILLGIRWLWWRMSGVEAMGLGDVKMLAMIGAFLGWQQVWLVLLLASLAGALVGFALIASGRRSMQSRLPFGTFLAVAAFAAAVIGERLIGWYIGLI
jgi:leader peptidase (prepilin peptidase)/N-methyltransferase